MHRKELLKLMPKHKDDASAAETMVALGYPIVDSVLEDMLLWMKVSASPVADIFATFFANLGEPALPLVVKQISKNEYLRNRLLREVLPNWHLSCLTQLRTNLTTLATHPDHYNNDIYCFRLLYQNNLVDKSWIQSWLRLRKKQAQKRVALIEELEQAR